MLALLQRLVKSRKVQLIAAVVVAVTLAVFIVRHKTRTAPLGEASDQMGAGLPDVKYVKELEGSFVLFSSSTCPHCVDMKPEWKKLADNKPDGVNVLNVEDDDKTFAKAGVMGFPTMALFKGGKALEYPGERKADAMRAFLEQHA